MNPSDELIKLMCSPVFEGLEHDVLFFLYRTEKFGVSPKA